MYKGPQYYHQPGHNQHLRTKELLEKAIGDGIIIPVQTTKKVSEKTFETFAKECQAFKTNLLFDVEFYDPSVVSPENTHDGSKVLADSQIRNTYVAAGLKIQHDLNCSAYIIPNFETTSINPSWYQNLRALGITAQEWISAHGNSNLPVYMTLCFPATDIIDDDNRMRLLNNLTSLKPLVTGFYINILNIPEILVDPALFRALLSLVLKLKWQQFDLIFSKVGFWVFTAFPLGLDVFGNGAFKSEQVAKSRRRPDADESHGFNKGGPTFVDVLSAEALNWVRYPDDAELLHKAFSVDEIGKMYGTEFGYNPPIQESPEKVKRSGGYKKPTRLNHVSAHMAKMARDFQGLSLNGRISAVEEKIKNALAFDAKIAAALKSQERGKEKQMWLDVFHRYLDEERKYIEVLYK